MGLGTVTGAEGKRFLGAFYSPVDSPCNCRHVLFSLTLICPIPKDQPELWREIKHCWVLTAALTRLPRPY